MKLLVPWFITFKVNLRKKWSESRYVKIVKKIKSLKEPRTYALIVSSKILKVSKKLNINIVRIVSLSDVQMKNVKT